MWSNILDFIKTDVGQTITSILLSLIGMLLICFFRWVANKSKNKRIKKLLNNVADAIELAEKEGSTPQEKLQSAVTYLQSKVPKSKKSDCELVIETAVACTKTNVNKLQERRSSTSTMTTRR